VVYAWHDDVVLALAVVFSFLLCTENKMILFAVLPVVATLSIVLTLFEYTSVYILVFGVIALLFLIMEIYKVTQYEKVFVNFNYKIIFSTCVKTFLTLICLTSAVMVLLNPAVKLFDVGNKVADLVADPLQKALGDQLNGMDGGSISNDQLNQIAQQYGLALPTGDSQAQISFHDIISQRVNQELEPYKIFVQPIIAALVFSIFQFAAWLAMLVYGLVIASIFKYAKEFGLVRSEKVMVEKEIVRL
jgi:hypothetical protein